MTGVPEGELAECEVERPHPAEALIMYNVGSLPICVEPLPPGHSGSVAQGRQTSMSVS